MRLNNQMKGGKAMEKSKLFKTFIILVLTFVFLYLFLENNQATEVTQVSALADVRGYAVYDGRDVYEHYKSILSEKEKIVYDELKEAYLQFKPSFSTTVEEIKSEELKRVFSAVILDHPEIFWIDSYSSMGDIFTGNVYTSMVIHLRYTFSKEEALQIKQQIESKYSEIIQGAKRYKSDKKRVKYVHDKLIEISEYTGYTNEQRDKFQSIISIFETGDTVCAGYSYGFKFIMDNLGIESIAVENINNKDSSKSHIWNKVKLDGVWYNLDVTWDSQLSKDSNISYKYYLLDNNEFYSIHQKPNIIISE